MHSHTRFQHLRKRLPRSQICQFDGHSAQYRGDLKRVEAEEAVDAIDGEEHPPADEQMIQEMQIE